MLSIGRKSGQSIVIGEDIRVTVIEVNGMIRLAVEAPREVSILRGELYDKEKRIPEECGKAEPKAKAV